MYFCFSVRQANTPLGLALGLAVVWEWHETKQRTTQPLRQAWTFLGDCLACRYAWMSVTKWERRHWIYSQALEPAGRQQRGHYGQALDRLDCPRGSTFGGRQESAGVLGSAGGDGSVEGWEKEGKIKEACTEFEKRIKIYCMEKVLLRC